MDYITSQLYERQAGSGPEMPSTPENELKDETTKLLSIVGFLYAIAATAVLLRGYVRIKLLKAFGPDDWLMAVAMFLSTACLVCIIYLTHFGLGKNVAILEYHPEWRNPLFAWLYFYSIFVIFAYSFIKLSINLFLIRLSQRTRYQPFLWGVFVFLILFTIGSTLAIILQCRPVAAGYDLTLRQPPVNGTCYDVAIFKKVGVFNSSINIATDLLFAILPGPMFWNVQVNIRTKIGLISILSLGFFASATAIYKTPMQWNFFNVTDYTGKGAWYYVWQIVEMDVGILAACLPTLKPLFISFFEHARAITSGSNNRTRRTGHSYNPSGYIKHHEPSASVSLNNLSSTTKNPYNAHVMSMNEPDKNYDADEAGYVHWDASSKGNESDEAPLHETPQSGRGGRGIVRTREVHIG